MNLDKQTKPDAAKTDPVKADTASSYTVGSAPIYIGTDRYDPATEVKLTGDQAKRLGAAVTPA